MDLNEIMRGAPIETADDEKRKHAVLSAYLEDLRSRFSMLFRDRKTVQAVRQAKRVGAAAANSLPLPDAGSTHSIHAAREIQSEGSDAPTRVAFSEIKPWQFLASGALTSGWAGDYGLQKVWDEGWRGQGVKVGVDDSGLVRGHADFDYARVDDDSYFLPSRDPLDEITWHGTAVAGVIGAQANGFGVVGVAHESTLWTSNFEATLDTSVADAIRAGCDVLNRSWGLTSSGEMKIHLGESVTIGRFHDQLARGRKGLGMSLVTSAGNSRLLGADTAVLPTTNHENVIAVASVGFNVQAADSSTRGEAVHIAAPGKDGNGGNDVLEGEAGNDYLHDLAGTALFNGGTGNDSLVGGDRGELYLGGQGNDTLTTEGGNDVLVFNKGDGQDKVYSKGDGRKTLSLGGDLSYKELRLSKSGQDLVLGIGSADRISFMNWYAAKPSRPVVDLQVIGEAIRGFRAAGNDPLHDQKVEHFDFAGLVAAFDADLKKRPTLKGWSLMKRMRDFRREGSDGAAIGGDLAYQYGRHVTLAGIGLGAAQAVIGDSVFGAQAQTLHTRDSLQSGPLRLS